MFNPDRIISVLQLVLDAGNSRLDQEARESFVDLARWVYEQGYQDATLGATLNNARWEPDDPIKLSELDGEDGWEPTAEFDEEWDDEEDVETGHTCNCCDCDDGDKE